MKEIGKIAAALFEKIRSRFENVTVGDEEAKATQNPEEARFFNFDYVSSDGHNFGNITVSIIDTKSLKLYFSKNISSDLDDEHKQEWYEFLRNMRMFAKRNMLNFDTRDINRGGLDIKDLKSVSQSDSALDSSELNVQESKLYGTTRSSYQMIGDAKMIVRHTGSIDEQTHGARARNIHGIYIENNQGERFKCPVNSLLAGRALARHVSNGGNLMDDISKHIVGMLQEMSDMRVFVRGMRNRQFEDAEATNMVEAATERYGDLHRSLKQLSSQRHYKAFTESYTPILAEEDDTDVNALKEKFVKKIFDDRMLTALPYVKKAYEVRQMRIAEQVKLVKEFVQSKQPLKLAMNENTDELLGVLTFENTTQVVIKVLETIADRVVDNAPLAEFAKRWASKYGTLGETVDANTKQESALAVQLATRYLKDLQSIKENKAYAEKVRVAAPSTYVEYVDPALQDFNEWTTRITEGTWAYPDTPQAMAELKKLFSQELPWGVDQSNVTGALYNLYGDDRLFDFIADAGRDEVDTDADARPAIIQYLLNNDPQVGQALAQVANLGQGEQNGPGEAELDEEGRSWTVKHKYKPGADIEWEEEGADGNYGLVSGTVIHTHPDGYVTKRHDNNAMEVVRFGMYRPMHNPEDKPMVAPEPNPSGNWVTKSGYYEDVNDIKRLAGLK